MELVSKHLDFADSVVVDLQSWLFDVALFNNVLTLKTNISPGFFLFHV